MESVQHAKQRAALLRRAAHLWHQVIGPLCLMVGCPMFAMAMWYTNDTLQGSASTMWSLLVERGLIGTWQLVWQPYLFGTPTAWAILATFAALQLLLLRLVPGEQFIGPATPSGHRPVYRANGIACFGLTLGLFALSSWGLGLFSPTIIADHFTGIIGALNAFSLVFCLALYLKGRYAPSPGEHGRTGNLIFDYYWGTELYPRIAGWDVKQWTNCRFGMMGWPLILLSFAAKQEVLYGITDGMLVAVGLQLLYVAKFFVWETGYLSSLDIMHDRAGFYICWGCLVWVPSIYTSSTAYLIHHPTHLGPALAALIGGLGALAILCNFWADRQRQRARQDVSSLRIWGKPAELLPARYTLRCGTEAQTVLLCSGWWGVARHCHYVLEILGAFCWTLPALFFSPTPYFYVLFLTVLLVHRSFRDEERCSLKYGTAWDAYKARVPYRLIPGLF